MKRTKMIKMLALMLVIVSCMVLSVSCKTEGGTTPSDGTDKGKKYEVAVMVKSLESDFWQIVLDGADKAAADQSDKVNVTHYGAKVENDLEEQISVLENILLTEPDGIVIAASNAEALVPQIEQAYDAGIPVMIIDTDVNTDKYVSFLRTSNVEAGKLAGYEMVRQWEAAGIDPTGKKVIVIQPGVGPTTDDREEGFRQGVLEKAPGVVILETQFAKNNDIAEVMSITDNVISANSADLIGMFATNNISGIGIARSIGEHGLQDQIFAIAFDSEQEEIDSVNEGILKGFVVQDPWGMGYLGVQYCVKVLDGETVESLVDTGATVINKDNINDPKNVALVDPKQRKEY